MCLNVLRCMGVTTVDKGDSDVEETAPTRRHAPVEEAAARIYPSGNGQHYPPKSDKRYPQYCKDEEAAAATSKVREGAARAAATSDSGSAERSPVKAKKEEYSPAADQIFDEYVVAGQPARRGYDEGLIRGAAVPAGAATYPAGQHKTAHGRDAYTVIVIPPIYADEASVKSISTSQEQGTGRRGQLIKTCEVGDAAGRSRRLEEAAAPSRAGFGSDH